MTQKQKTAASPLRKRRCTECGATFFTKDPNRTKCQNCQPVKKTVKTSAKKAAGKTASKPVSAAAPSASQNQE